jgi:hypothetical protein
MVLAMHIEVPNGVLSKAIPNPLFRFTDPPEFIAGTKSESSWLFKEAKVIILASGEICSRFTYKCQLLMPFISGISFSGGRI